MDATKRPIQIPPAFSVYGEKHGVFELFKDMMQQLLIHKPDEPLRYLISYLSRESNELPSVIILGPPSSGKCTMARLLSTKIRAVHLTKNELPLQVSQDLVDETNEFLVEGKELPDDLWVKVITERLNMNDVSKRGYILDGFPETREQAVALQAAGISANKCILLEAPDTVLLERAEGKRVDPETGDIYHTTFDWPSTNEIRSRLTHVPGYTEAYLKSQLDIFHRNSPGIIECYKSVLKRINADQPKPDIFALIYQFVSSRARSVAPFTPRILLLGSTGAGKAVQAALLANKYGIIDVSCGKLVKEAIASEGIYSATIQAYIDQGMQAPDNIVLELITNRLKKIDCVIKGWVLHGYPLNSSQALQLRTTGFEPNRVFFLEVPNDSIVERLMLRMTDPVTGDRYHLLYNPPRIAEIRDRLTRHPKDEEDSVRRQLKIYHAYKDDLEDFYQKCLHINGDQDPHTVFETIESMTVNRLPKTFEY